MSEQRGTSLGQVASHGVSVDVWRDLAPESEHAAARERRALLKGALAVGAVTVVGAVVVWSGLASPRLGGGDNSGGGADPTGRQVMFEFDLHNQGLMSEHVVGWTSQLAGVAVESSNPSDVRLPARAQARVRLTFRVTDCDLAVGAVRAVRGSLPYDGIDGSGVGVRVARPWGTVGATVTPPSGIDDLVLNACGTDPTAEGQ